MNHVKMSYFHRREDDGMLVVGDFEFNDELYQEFLPVTITPSIRDFLWEFTECNGRDWVGMFDVDADLAEECARNIANDACDAYLYDVTSEERLAMHERKLQKLMIKTDELVAAKEWRQMIGVSILAHLSELKGPPRRHIDAFREAIRDVQHEAQSSLEMNACEFEAEQEWKPLPEKNDMAEP